MFILFSCFVFFCCWANIAYSSPAIASAVVSTTREALAQGAFQAIAQTMTEKTIEGAGSLVIWLSKYFNDNLANVQVTSEVVIDEFVSRTELEGVIRGIMSIKRPEKYYVVYGAKGVGKSTLVDKVAEDFKAVVKVAVRSVDDMNTITAKFMQEVTGVKQTVDVDVLRKALKDFKSRKDITPIIIFEVEPCATDPKHKSILQIVRTLAKDLVGVCNSIIVISEANAVFEFGNDGREGFVYVDEMTYEESEEYLSKRGLKITEEQTRKIYDNIGGHVVTLQDLLSRLNHSSLDASIKALVHRARGDLVSFQLKPILLAIKNIPNIKNKPKGVQKEEFEGQTYKGFDLSDTKAVGDAMTKDHVLVYRMDLDPEVFQMQSTRHNVALDKYEPVIDYNVYTFPKLAPKPEPATGPKSEL